MAPLPPEAGHRFADRGIVAVSVTVDVAGVDEFGGGGGADEVDFGVGEGFEVGEGEGVGEGVDLGVVQELVARGVGFGEGGVGGEGVLVVGELGGEVFARVEVFEDGGDGGEGGVLGGRFGWHRRGRWRSRWIGLGGRGGRRGLLERRGGRFRRCRWGIAGSWVWEWMLGWEYNEAAVGLLGESRTSIGWFFIFSVSSFSVSISLSITLILVAHCISHFRLVDVYGLATSR